MSTRRIALTITRLLLGLLVGVGLAAGIIALIHVSYPNAIACFSSSSLLLGASILAGRVLHEDDPKMAVIGLMELLVGVFLGFGTAMFLLGVPTVLHYY